MQDIKFLTGVGPKRAELLYSELGVNTFHDLLYYFPYKYVDRTKFYTIREINGNMPYVQVIGKIVSFEKVGEGSKTRLSAVFADKTGTLELIWFKGIKWVMQNVQKNKAYILFGKPSLFSGRLNIVHPELDEITDAEEKVTGSIQAFYNTSEKMKKNYLSSKGVLKLQANLMHAVRNSISETLPSWFTAKYKMMPLPRHLKLFISPKMSISCERRSTGLNSKNFFIFSLKF